MTENLVVPIFMKFGNVEIIMKFSRVYTLSIFVRNNVFLNNLKSMKCTYVEYVYNINERTKNARSSQI